MLARLQQLLSLLILTIPLGLVLFAPQGIGLAGACVLLCALGYAAVLGLEFVLMHHQNRQDPAPRARRWQCALAWWHELWAAPRVFGWRQPWRSRRRPDHLPSPATPGRPTTMRPVLFVHGFVCNRGLWLPWLDDLQATDAPYAAVDLEPVFGPIDDYLPLIEQAVARLESCRLGPPVIVAHSMGGLAVRAWWAQPGNLGRVQHLITLGSPHHGTWLARWAQTPNTRQMRRGSDWLRRLGQAERPDAAARLARTTCYYSHCDNIVFPASTATLAGADNRHLAGTAHVQMADHPAPRADLMRRLRRVSAGHAAHEAPGGLSPG